MLLANDEAVMTVLDALNFFVLNPTQLNNPIPVPRRKLIEKIDEHNHLTVALPATTNMHRQCFDAEVGGCWRSCLTAVEQRSVVHSV